MGKSTQPTTSRVDVSSSHFGPGRPQASSHKPIAIIKLTIPAITKLVLETTLATSVVPRFTKTPITLNANPKKGSQQTNNPNTAKTGPTTVESRFLLGLEPSSRDSGFLVGCEGSRTITRQPATTPIPPSDHGDRGRWTAGSERITQAHVGPSQQSGNGSGPTRQLAIHESFGKHDRFASLLPRKGRTDHTWFKTRCKRGSLKHQGV